ncbi:class I SAM-dependent methyltransferase [Kribbella amoyensis]|uniref:class I SAM-dependent methyltransferase n=1 Tax=Kribbella amoyensis TaxID=996641 RepID=UPI001EE1906D|nr:class I SAM-dependent methyltransferase [Kribbella amoyensis]
MSEHEKGRRVLSWEEAQSFDHLAERYDRLGELSTDPVGDWLPSILPATGRRALDLGCGAGRHSVLLAEVFEHVDAVDLSGAMVRLAQRKRARPNIEYREAGVFDVAGSYDFVLSSATLHHVPDLPAALRHIRGLVAPDGRIALADTVSKHPSTPRWWLYGGEVRKFARNLVNRGPAEAWEIFRLSTGPWLDHRVSDRYLDRDGFERVYGAAYPGATFVQVGRAHAALWQRGTD